MPARGHMPLRITDQGLVTVVPGNPNVADVELTLD